MDINSLRKGERQLHFERLATARNPERIAASGDATFDLEHQANAERFEAGLNTHVGLEQMRDGLTRRMLRLVDTHVEPKAATSIHQGLLSDQPAVYHRAVRVLQKYITAHPEIVQHDPYAHVIAALPPHLAFVSSYIVKHGFQSPSYCGAGAKFADGKSDLKALPEEERPIPDEEYLRLRLADSTALQIGNGAYADIEPFVNTALADVKSNQSAADREQLDQSIAQLLANSRLLKAGLQAFGDRWQEKIPGRYKIAEQYVADIEWLFDNPLLSTEQTQTVHDVLMFEPIALRLAKVTRGGSASIAWPNLLHKLWHEPSRAQEQWDTFIKLTRKPLHWGPVFSEDIEDDGPVFSEEREGGVVIGNL